MFTVRVLPAFQLTALEFAKLSLCAPEPSLMVALPLNVSVPSVSLKPVVAPVLKVPPCNTKLVLSLRTLALFSWSVPALMVVVPV